jgi:hypothetical protein
VLALVAPTVVEKFPAPQVTHALAPAVDEYDPAGQFVHDTLPMLFLFFPIAQALQALPSVPVYPMLHLQSEIVLVLAENELVDPVGHVIQDDNVAETFKFAKSKVSRA